MTTHGSCLFMLWWCATGAEAVDALLGWFVDGLWVAYVVVVWVVAVGALLVVWI